MEALASSFSSFQFTTIPTRVPRIQLDKPMLNHLPSSNQRLSNSSLSSIHKNKAEFRLFTATSSSSTVSTEFADPTEEQVEIDSQGEKFDWYAQWYPVMPVCDLDKRVPHAKKVMGLDVVVWWDRNESAWKVFDDMCPHRLAPLSEGRIDQWGRLQCVYHGWCFNGSGDCKFIPQAPPDGPPVHTFKKACVAAYPSTVQNDIVWFWPNSDPQYKDILSKNKPPYIPELDDPSYTRLMGNREIPYGYADIKSTTFLVFFVFKQNLCTASDSSLMFVMRFLEPSSNVPQRRFLLIFICIPVSPGNSRLIWTFPRNVGVWIDRVVPRWMFHVGQNLILDSDLYLLHLEERKIMDIGPSNWQKACFVPTKSDALVVSFRRWLNKYAGGQVDWGTKFSGALPPTPPREQLLDRYWSHVVNCRSCNVAYKGLNVLEVVLQVMSIASIGVVAAAKQNMLSAAARNTLIFFAVLSFVASRWLAHFVYKNFRYHDYNHALR
ncbi:hypothetical protein TEA_010902 [Camellia sinensis var. sinensis]|uniref:Rieske domain-containing protein n=1 Tax=Camellia sinensis var. sinensis TaxID=542762 RepID=A0A4S4E9L6_CAMSN|nr:hypothetical protein TEA_010902 [Camellia sinensis var. sinensis]